MADKQLLETILDGGIAHANFLNGYLLSAESLRTEQDAQDAMHRHLAQAVGSGVIHGLDVATIPGESERLGITPGLALNNHGQLLHLEQEVVLKLTGALSTLGEEVNPCAIVDRDTFYSAPGIYLLVVSPATGYRGQASMHALPGQGVSAACAKAQRVDGVQFRLLGLDAVLENRPDFAADELQLFRLRNWLAAQTIGTGLYWQAMEGILRDPCGSRQDTSYSLFEDLDALGSRDVPLAVLQWGDGGLQFIDAWAARRPPVPGRPQPLGLADRRYAEMQALGMHFQCLATDLLDAAAGSPGIHPAQLQARDWLSVLPAAGYLNTGESEFSASTFFAGFDRIETDCLNRASLRRHLEHAWLAEPIYLSSVNLPEISYWNVAPGLTFFMRYDPPCGELRYEVQEPVGTDEEASPPSVEVQPAGSANLLLGVIGDLSFLGESRQLLKEYGPEVWAVGEDGRKHHPRKISSTKLGDLLAAFGSSRKRGNWHESVSAPVLAELFGGSQPDHLLGYSFRKLPAGLYTFYAKAAGRAAANVSSRVFDKQMAKVALLLDLSQKTPETARPGPKPDRGYLLYGDARWLRPEWWKEFWIPDWKIEHLEKPPRSPFPDPYPDPIPEKAWFEHLLKEVETRFPDVSLRAGDVTFHLDPSYAPGGTTIPAKPYAYLRFGDTGIYAPVILTTEVAGTRLDKTGLGGLENQPGGKLLMSAGMNRVEILAAAWSGLVEEVMEIGADSAIAIVVQAGESMAGVDGLSSLVPDEETRDKLGSKGYRNAVAIANAEPLKLAREIGLELPKVIGLVEMAREAVPRRYWALDNLELGAESAAGARLKELNINTLGQLEAAIDADGTHVELLGDEQETAENKLRAHKAGLAAKQGTNMPVYRLAKGETARALFNAGVPDVASLANMDEAAKVALEDVDASVAEHLVAEAQNLINNMLWKR